MWNQRLVNGAIALSANAQGLPNPIRSSSNHQSMIRKRGYCFDFDESARSCWCDSEDSNGGAAVAPDGTGCGIG